MSLQELVAEQLGALSLRDDPDTVEFVVGLVEEESFESEVSTLSPLLRCRLTSLKNTRPTGS